MAMILENWADFVRQPDDQEGLTSEGKATHAIVYKGDYSALQTAARALEIGERIVAFHYLESWNLRRTPGDTGILTLNCAVLEEETTGSVTKAKSKLLKDVWSCRSVRNDVSIMAYCGGEGYANRALIEAWQKEPDGNLAKQYKFKNSAGKPEEIKDEATKDVIKKIEKGIEAVMRFYPIITRKRTYDREPDATYENLARVNAPPVPLHYSDKNATALDNKVRVPKGLAGIVNMHTWLKIQDDAEEQPDSKWIRTESWMGVQTWSERYAWDPDLYGQNAWTMPHGKGDGGFGNDIPSTPA